MIDWLKTLPQDAEVKCGVEKGGAYDRYMTYEPVDIDSCNVCNYSSDTDLILYPNEDVRIRYPSLNNKVVVYISGD
jgi:hypothetical protein